MNITWSNLHPLIVHFPIALLLIAPLFIAMSLLRKSWLRRYAVPALLLLVIGTTASWGAKKSGHAAMMRADAPAAAEAVMEEHEDLAKSVLWIFGGLTAGYALVVGVLATRPQSSSTLVRVGLLVVLLGVNGFGAVQLSRAAHLGGILVHGYGIHAEIIGLEAKPEATSAAAGGGLDLER